MTLSDDTYKTIQSPTSGLYKEKGSKFLSFAEPVGSEDEAKAVIEKYRKQFHDARHHCFAWAIGFSRELQRMNDDGEPSGTAGRPIFGQILSFDVTYIIIVVVRYFGGTKLGTSGLINAYKLAAKDALNSATIVEKTIQEVFELQFEYPETNEVMRNLKEYDFTIIENIFTDNCKMIVSVRKKNATLATKSLEKIRTLTFKHLKTS